MGRRFVEHTGEVELLLDAATEEGILEEALAAFAELVDRGGEGRHGRRTIELASPDRHSLLVDWVNELVFLADMEGFVPERVEEIEITLGDGRTRATVAGRAGAGPAGLVKAATFSRTEFARREDGWRARLVLDV